MQKFVVQIPAVIALLVWLFPCLYAQGVETGLLRPFPPVVQRPDNPTTKERIELGKLLFFDPVLSGDNAISCAHCHHPNRAFSDGIGTNQRQEAVKRSTPTLWNVLYNNRQFWDGRAKDLEQQAQEHIIDASVMAADPQKLVEELNAIATYQDLFAQAFGGEKDTAVTFANTVKAIAAFERSLVSNNSRFDRYAAGDANAFDEQQRRGLKLFLSTKTSCVECHSLPTFTSPGLKVIGVPDIIDGASGAFKTPTLRNVALTAPYMHNNAFKTLDEVVDFYTAGGGRNQGADTVQIDARIRKFSLTETEKKDLIAFLHTLTDISALPKIPTELPSKLAVVDEISTTTTQETIATTPINERSPVNIEVKPGQSLQAAIDQASNGSTILVHPGIYRESLLIVHHHFTIEGIVIEDQRPVLDGGNSMADAVIALGDNFHFANFAIRHYQGKGVATYEANHVTLRNLKIDDPGLYGISSEKCEHVLVEKCTISGAHDTGIGIAHSQHLVVRDNEIFRNVAGIKMENSRDIAVENNYVHQNTGGILVLSLPLQRPQITENIRIIGNRIHYNNTPNFANDEVIIRDVLHGTGVMVLAADRTEIAKNEIVGNDSFAIAVANLALLYPDKANFVVDRYPDHNSIHDNIFRSNAQNPDERIKKYLIPARDLIWDGSGKNNVWNEKNASSYPLQLPGTNKSAQPDVEKKNGHPELLEKIDYALELLSSEQYAKLISECANPHDLQKILAKGITIEQLVEQFASTKAKQLHQALQSIRDKAPEMSDDGQKAKFQYEDNNLYFSKIDGVWYLDKEQKTKESIPGELRKAIDEAIALLEEKQYQKCLSEYANPHDLEQILEKGITVEQLAEKFAEKNAAELLKALKFIKDKKPKANKDGTVEFIIHWSKKGRVSFSQIEGKWYINNR